MLSRVLSGEHIWILSESDTMRTIDEIDEIMKKLPVEWRRWCGHGGVCACIGAANCSAKYIYKEENIEPITEEEFQRWEREQHYDTVK